jgi:NTE family protein
VTAVDASSGELAVFDHESGVALARAVAPSRAIPGLLPPIEIHGRRYVDGAIGSATNAALVAGAALAVVVSPVPPSAPAGTLESIWARALDDELVVLAEHGTTAVCVDASPADMAAMGPDLLSAKRVPPRSRPASSAGSTRPAGCRTPGTSHRS